jgi:hypothetical protein
LDVSYLPPALDERIDERATVHTGWRHTVFEHAYRIDGSTDNSVAPSHEGLPR